VSPGRLDPGVIADRASWIRTMLAGIRSLPLDDFTTFTNDRHKVAAAESYLRRAIESLVDLGRHILAKRFAVAVSEYKAIPPALADAGVLERAQVARFVEICGYRNRLVHFYFSIARVMSLEFDNGTTKPEGGGRVGGQDTFQLKRPSRWRDLVSRLSWGVAPDYGRLAASVRLSF
jgi:uncharacterized protein YutE (UPF0331/DUF86 family)